MNHARVAGAVLMAITSALLLSACAPLPETVQPLPTVQPTATRPNPSPTASADALSKILWASDPGLPGYDPGSAAFAEFPVTVREISAMGAGGIDAADDLAAAIRFPREDAYLAAQALIALGPDITATTLPLLLDDLRSPKEDARIDAAVLLGYTGSEASCAVGNLGPLLWDTDARVRTAAAIALDKITGGDLVAGKYEAAITPSFQSSSLSPDTPEGTVVGEARKWWNEQGSKINWHPGYDLCDP